MIDNNDNHLSASTGAPPNPTQHNCSKVRDTFWTPPTRLSRLRPYHLEHKEEDDDDTSWTLPTILTYLKSLVQPARIPPREVLCLCLGDIWNILLSFLVNVSSPSHNFDRGGNFLLYVSFLAFASLASLACPGCRMLVIYYLISISPPCGFSMSIITLKCYVLFLWSLGRLIALASSYFGLVSLNLPIYSTCSLVSVFP